MPKILLSASILSANFEFLHAQISSAEAAGVDWIHVDVMDGHFVPNITMGPFIIETIRRITRLPIDVHLMVDNPKIFTDQFAKAGANHLSIHIEGNPDAPEILRHIREIGCRPGIVLKPETPAVEIVKVIHLVDIILIMTVNPGYSGQQFIPETIQKISETKTLISRCGASALIQVDGGITPETLPLTQQAGADVFVSATGIFKNPAGIFEGVSALRASVSNIK